MNLRNPLSLLARLLIPGAFLIGGFNLLIAQSEAEYIQGELFAKVSESSSANLTYSKTGDFYPEGLQEIIETYEITAISNPFTLQDARLQKTYVVNFNAVDRAQELIDELNALSFIEYAEGVPAYKFFYTPNDVHPNQWHLTTVLAEQAWDMSTGSSNVVIAMVDDAVLLSHEDLAPVIWVNSGEILNGIDDDNNGYIDDINGWDAADSDNDPNPLNPTNSYFTHGTHCAGIAAAKTDNGIGIASVSFNVSLMAVKIGADANSLLSGAFQGVDYAIAAEADIISMSWGGGGFSQTYQNLFDIAHNNGIVLIAAAGNSNTTVPMYPASYNFVISVGATSSSDQKASFSNYGSTIDVMAPGQSIWSSLAGSNSSYDYLSGTSMACPLVSSLAALMLSRDPNLTPDELEDCLKSSCDNIDAQNLSYIGLIGSGRINAYEALRCLKPISAEFTSDFTRVCPGDTVQFTDLSTNNPIAWQWSFPGGFPSSSASQNPSIIYSAPGTYSVMLIATNIDSVDTIVKTNYITVGTPSATISGSTNIALGYSANLRVDLTGSPNWSIIYFDGSVNTTINNITNSPFFINVSPNVNTTYTLVSVSDNGCAGTVADSAIITVINSLDTTCFKLQPGAAIGNDVLLNGRPSQVNNNFGTHPDILASAWTFGGIPGNLRCLLDFDLSSIPSGAAIISADLSLFYNPTSGNAGHSSLSGSNVSVLSRVTSTWDEMTVTWNTQPSVTTLNEVILAQSTTTTQDYPNIDVTAMVQDMVDNPTTSFGFRFKLITESYYRSMLFASSDNADSTNWPILEICYVSPSAPNPPPCPGILSFEKISDTQGNFSGILDNSDLFGRAVTPLGDMNSDGVIDLAIGAEYDDDGGTNRGAIWIMFMNSDGTVNTYQKISDTQGGFTGILDNSDLFGVSLASIGDLDGDSITDLVAGAWQDDDGGPGRGAVWILFLNSDGTVKSHQKISDTQGNFTGILDDGDRFGINVTSLGDLDNDGITDIAVGATKDDDGGADRGAVWILFLNSDGTVKSHQKISDTQGNFGGILNNNDEFAHVSFIGDLNGDGNADIAVGAGLDDDGATDAGANWILFLDSNGTVINYQKISATQGNFGGTLIAGDNFGMCTTPIGDFNNDGVVDLLVGAWRDNDGGSDRGAVWILYMNIDGTVVGQQKISDTQGGFTGTLDNVDYFGVAVANIGDLDGNGIADFAIGARADDDGGTDRGAVWIMFMEDTCAPVVPDPCPALIAEQKISDTQGNFTGSLDNMDLFGRAVAEIGDVNGDGIADIAVGAYFDDDGGTDRGAIWILFLNTDGTVNSEQKISDTQGTFTGVLDDGDGFGISVASIGDLDGDGIPDIAVGSYFDDDGGTDIGAVWILFLNSDGTVKAYQKISSTQGLFTGILDVSDAFGLSISAVGDVDGDNVIDLVVGAVNDDDGGLNKGAVWIIFLNTDGTVKSQQKISEAQGNFTGVLGTTGWFGGSVASIGDFDGDNIPDIAIGAPLDDDGGLNRGAVWLIFLNSNGTVKTHQKISDTQGGFTGTLDDQDRFGVSVTSIGDLDGDGITDIASGASFDGDGGTQRGAVWIMFLNNVGAVKSYQKISSTAGNFTGVLDNVDYFGVAITSLGDLDGNGSEDLAVGAQFDDDGGSNKGAVWILFFEDTCAPDSQICSGIADFAADTVCLGDSTSFTDLSIDSIANTIIWNWNFGDGDTLIGVQNPKHLYSTAGVFNVTLIIGSDVTPACYNTITKAVLVLDTLFVKAPPDDSICLGDSISLGPLNIICGDAPFTYSWAPSSDLSDPTSANPKAGPVITTTYYITVTDAQGIVFTDSITIYVGTGCCKSWAVIDADNSYCLGDSVYLLNVSIAKNGAVYIWDFGANATPASFVGDNPPPVYYDTSGQSTVRLIVIDSCGTDTGYFDINIYPLPIADAGNDTTVCVLDSIQIGSIPLSFHSYSWSPSAGLSDTTISNPIANTSSSITYVLTITDIVSGCTNRDSITLTIDSVIAFAGNDTTLCLGDSIQLNGSGGTQYSWTPSTGLSDDSIQNPWAKPIDTTTYFMTVTDSNGCSESDSIIISVAPQSQVAVGIDTSICLGDSASISATGGVSYAWSPPTGLNNDTISNPWASPVDSMTYIVIVTDANNCTLTDSVRIDVIPLPFADAGVDVTICSGDSVQLSASGGAAYTWSPGNNLSNIFIQDPWAGPMDTTTYIVWVEDSIGCTEVDTIIVMVEALPFVIASNDTLICLGDQITISALGSGNHLWNTGDTVSSIIVAPTGDSLYQVTATNSCGSAIDSIWVFVNLAALADAGQDGTVSLGSSIQLLGLPSGPGLSYAWTPTSSLNCSLCQNPIATPNNTTVYYLTITDSLGCETFDVMIITVDNSVTLYVPEVFSPNGDGENDFFFVQGKGIDYVNVMIFDRWGKKIFEKLLIEANDKYLGWDGTYKGKPLNAAVFVYTISGRFINGTDFNEAGDFTLVR